MTEGNKNIDLQDLPRSAQDFIKLVVRKMRYRKNVRTDVTAELAAHFIDELRDCKTDEEKEQRAEKIIEQFGDPKLLAVLMRRAKKRCRPLWRTIVARTCQTIVVLFLCFILYALWFMTGKPNIKTDYIALWNQMSQPKVADEDNAWPNYDKAIQLYVGPNEDIERTIKQIEREASDHREYFADLTDDQRDLIGQWLKQNEAAWQEFRKAATKNYCYRKYYTGDPNNTWLMGMLLPHLSELRGLAKFGIWRARSAIQQGDINQAMEDCVTVARAGRHWQGKRTLIEQLVGIAKSSLACQEIINIVSEQNLDSNQLRQFHQRLSSIYSSGFPVMNMEGERLFFLDTVQHVFTEGGPGGGHLIPNKVVPFMNSVTGDDMYGNEESIKFIAGSFIHAGRDKTITKVNQLYDELSEIYKMTPYQKHIKNIRVNDLIIAVPKYRYFLIQILTPSLDRAFEMQFRHNTLHHATITILALKRWRLDKGRYPDNLNELVDVGYMKELPMDPYSDKPLIYKRLGDEFTLYSVGVNFKDDGGEIATKYNKIEEWDIKEAGDAVFWPVQK
jgi:hypothetical protein